MTMTMMKEKELVNACKVAINVLTESGQKDFKDLKIEDRSRFYTPYEYFFLLYGEATDEVFTFIVDLGRCQQLTFKFMFGDEEYPYAHLGGFETSLHKPEISTMEELLLAIQLLEDYIKKEEKRWENIGREVNEYRTGDLVQYRNRNMRHHNSGGVLAEVYQPGTNGQLFLKLVEPGTTRPLVNGHASWCDVKLVTPVEHRKDVDLDNHVYILSGAYYPSADTIADLINNCKSLQLTVESKVNPCWGVTWSERYRELFLVVKTDSTAVEYPGGCEISMVEFLSRLRERVMDKKPITDLIDQTKARLGEWGEFIFNMKEEYS